MENELLNENTLEWPVITDEIGKFKMFLKSSKNESRSYQHHLNMARTVVREKLIGMHV